MIKKMFLVVLIMILSVELTFGQFSKSNNKVEPNISVVSDFEFGLINDLEIGNDKKIYVNDLFLGLLVFDEKGELILEHNSKGQGPGDFASISDLLVIDNMLYTVDSELFRVTVYEGNSLKYKDSFNLRPLNNKEGNMMSPARIWRLSNSNFVVEYKGSYTKNNIKQDKFRQYSLTDSLFNIINEDLFTSRDREMLIYSEGNDFVISMHPFGKDELVDISPDGNVYKFWTEESCINVIEVFGGNKLSEFCVDDLQREDIPDNKFKLLDESEDALLYKKVELPKMYPLAEEMFVSSGSKNHKIWITKRKNTNVTELIEINSNSGTIKKSFEVGDSFKLLNVSNNVIYGINRIDPVSGYQPPKIYRIVIN